MPLISLVQFGAVHDDIVNEIPLKIEASRWSKYALWREESSRIFAEIVPKDFWNLLSLRRRNVQSRFPTSEVQVREDKEKNGDVKKLLFQDYIDRSYTIQETLRREAENKGMDLFGAADLTIARRFIYEQGGEHLRIFPRAISIGMHLLDTVVDEIYRHQDPAAIFTYRGHYSAVNAHLDQVALSLSKIIQEKDYKAYPIPASQKISHEKLMGVISHKLVAHLAGLGWIGKNCLLITPDYGPRVRFETIMTDAPLKTGSPISNRCGECLECIDICPVKAFTGVPFDPSESREKRFKATLCEEYRNERKEKLGEGSCGLCVYICPYGTRNKEHPSFKRNSASRLQNRKAKT